MALIRTLSFLGIARCRRSWPEAITKVAYRSGSLEAATGPAALGVRSKIDAPFGVHRSGEIVKLYCGVADHHIGQDFIEIDWIRTGRITNGARGVIHLNDERHHLLGDGNEASVNTPVPGRHEDLELQISLADRGHAKVQPWAGPSKAGCIAIFALSNNDA
jgi:hypothetical protein